jgi:peptidoglycan-associated lipoprotein
MKVVTDLKRIAREAMLLMACLLLGACSHAKQTQAAAPPAPSQKPSGATNMQRAAPIPPNTPTASNVVISEEVKQACNIPDQDAYFAFDSSRLTAFDEGPLDQVATCFTSGPMTGRRLRLVGHADPRGGSDYNVTLGQARADAVADYLRGHGVRPDHATTTSRGAMDATGQDETGWAHDRRVDVMLDK